MVAIEEKSEAAKGIKVSQRYQCSVQLTAYWEFPENHLMEREAT